ncbi:MAG: ATP-binding protein [Ignavibacteriaceae bacterium]|nr:ATP-binding protein [Ignavibacteriaceae bacterium]
MKLTDFESSLDTPTKTDSFSVRHSEKTKTLDLILDITKSLNRTLILKDVLTLVLNNAILLTNSDRGFIVLKNNQDKLDFAIGLNSKGTSLTEKDFQISTTVIEEVFHTGLARFIEEAQSDTNNDISKSILLLDLQTILCAPLIIGDKKIGVIYLDSKSLNKIKIKEITNAFEILAGQAAIAIQNAQSFKEQIDANKELVRVNNELNEARIIAEKSSKFKSSLMKNMSHEFRTPMNGILGLGGILREALNDHEDAALLDKMMDASKRLLKTLSEILDLSDLESTTIQLGNDVINVSKVVEDIASSSVHSAEEKKLELIVDIKNDFFIKFDERYFHQLLESLIENALKFTSHGYVQITCDVNNEKGIIKVTDSGIGISPENQETIFEAFRQASEGFDRSYEGCGLGLTLVKKIIDLAGGSISVESKVGAGTTFVLSFPNPENPVNYEAPLHPKNSYSRPLTYRTPNILLVEDNELNLDTFRIFLKNIAMLEIAETPKLALQLAGTIIFDLVLIDIKLSNNKNGIELMKEIKRMTGYNEIPFIATTGYALRGDKETFLKVGFSDYLSKPFTKIQLTDIIKKNFRPA